MALRAENDTWADQIYTISQLCVGLTPILTGRDCAQLGAGKLKLNIFRPILGHDCDSVSDSDPNSRKGMGKLIYALIELGIAQATAFILNSYAIAARQAAKAKEFTHDGSGARRLDQLPGFHCKLPGKWTDVAEEVGMTRFAFQLKQAPPFTSTTAPCI
jgi:hypothetical protein